MPNPLPIEDYPGRGSERSMFHRTWRRRHTDHDARAYLIRIFAECGCSVTRLARRMRVSTQHVYKWMHTLGFTPKKMRALIPPERTLTSTEELIRLMDSGRLLKASTLLHAMFDRFESQAEVARQLEIQWRTLRRWMSRLGVERRGRTTRKPLTEFQRAMLYDVPRARAMLAYALSLGTYTRAAAHLHVQRRHVQKAIQRFGGGSFYPQVDRRRSARQH